MANKILRVPSLTLRLRVILQNKVTNTLQETVAAL